MIAVRGAKAEGGRAKRGVFRPRHDGPETTNPRSGSVVSSVRVSPRGPDARAFGRRARKEGASLEAALTGDEATDKHIREGYEAAASPPKTYPVQHKGRTIRVTIPED